LDATGGYDLPIFLEDRTGLLTGTEFTDLYNRLRINYVCLSDDDSMGTTSAPTILLEQSNWATMVTQLRWMIICPEYPVLLARRAAISLPLTVSDMNGGTVKKLIKSGLASIATKKSCHTTV